MLVAAYIGILIWQFVWLISACKARKGWLRLIVLEVISAAASLTLMFYYDSLPGIGMMPGLTYFAEVMYSMLFATVYAVMAVISGICGAVRTKSE